MSKDQVVSDLHYDVEQGFGSAKQLFTDARKAGLAIALNEVQEFLRRSQTLNQRKNYKNSNSYSPPFARSACSVDF